MKKIPNTKEDRDKSLKYLRETLTPKQKRCLENVIFNTEPKYYDTGHDGLSGPDYELDLEETIEHLIEEII